MAQFLSILPPEKDPPTSMLCPPMPNPLKQFAVDCALANAVATGIFGASTWVLLVMLVVFPEELFDAVADPPAPPVAVFTFEFEEFPEFESVEFPEFFNTDAPPVAVAEPPLAVLEEFPPVAFDELFEPLAEVLVAVEFEFELLDEFED